MDRRDFLVAGAALSLGGCAGGGDRRRAARQRRRTPPSGPKRIAALRPPKRARPVVAVLGSPHGAETTDLVVPYGVLRQSGLADVHVRLADNGGDAVDAGFEHPPANGSRRALTPLGPTAPTT